MGSLFSGLIGGFGDAWKEHADRKHEDEVRDKEMRIRILESASKDPNLTDDAHEQIMHQLLEVTGAGGKGKGGKKGGPMAGGLMGLFTGGKGKQGGQSQGGQSQAQPQGGKPQTLGNPPTPPQAKQQGVGEPPSPPQQLTMTHEQQMQRGVQDQNTMLAAKHAEEVKEGRADRQQAIQDFEEDYKKQNNGQEPDKETKERLLEKLYGIEYKQNFKPTPGAQPEKDPQGRYFRRTYDQHGQEGPPQIVGAPKESATQEKFQQKVVDWQSANPQKKGESPEDYEKRGNMTVHKMQFTKDMNSLLDSGLRRMGISLSNSLKSKMIQDYADNGTMSRKMANILRSGASMRAKRRMDEGDPSAYEKSFNDLIEEELNAIGTSESELQDVLGTPKKSTGGSKSGNPKTAEDYEKSIK